MKKSQGIMLAAAAAVLIAAGTMIGVQTAKAVERAEQTHAAVYEEYRQLLAMADEAVLTVSEDGKVVGSYDLSQLGVLDDARDEVSAQFGELDRLSTEDFKSLSLLEKIRWNKEKHPKNVRVELPMTGFDPSPVMQDLARVPRREAQDAFMTYEDGSYRIHSEQAGTILREETVREGLKTQTSLISFGAAAQLQQSFELTDTECYHVPEITVENAGFDPAAELTSALDSMEIRVVFHTGEEVLDKNALAELVVLDESGEVRLAEDKVDALLGSWAQTYNTYDTPYLFNSYAGGVVPIEFLSCDYELNTQQLRNAIFDLIIAQQSGTLEAPYNCYDEDGNPFAVENTYVEVDIANQQMTYYKDGELIVNTDVVTGRVGASRTPTGLYYSHDKRVNRWLVGDDYCVFVKYWIRIWKAYGLHDASWRTIFGGDQYIVNGSHGCVNTPEEAMAKIYENIVDGTPVLVFNYAPPEQNPQANT